MAHTVQQSRFSMPSQNSVQRNSKIKGTSGDTKLGKKKQVMMGYKSMERKNGK